MIIARLQEVTMHTHTSLRLILGALVAFSGCSYFVEEETYRLPPAEEVTREENSATKEGLELVWEVPAQPVEFYHLAYGPEAGSTARTLKIPVSELEKVDDPRYGPVFRYLLHGVEKGRPIYISLRAENRQGISDPSEIMSSALNQ
jgi:hypothetical protein